MKFFHRMIILSLFFSICSLACGEYAEVEAIFKEESPLAKIVVYENNIVKKADRAMLGYNHFWISSERIVMDRSNNCLDISEEYLNAFKGYPMPLNRVAGTDSQFFKWKWAIGPLEERKEQKLMVWDKMTKKRLGPIEWIKSVLLIDPTAKFTWTLNMVLDAPEDHADLSEFLTGDGKSNPNGGINWAKKRIEMGIKEPVDIVIWELGNELDWKEFRKYFPTVYVYIEACKKAIAAIKKVHPEAKFAAHAASTPQDTEYHKAFGGWEKWHREVLRHLSEQIDYIVFHPYYDGISQARQEGYMDVIKADILKIIGTDRIKFYVSEHAKWPGHEDKSRPWKDYWYKTHALSGVLSTAEWLNRMLIREDVATAVYHCFSGGPWGLIYKDEKKEKLYTTGIADLFKTLNEAYGKNVVRTEISGEFTDVKKSDCTLTVGVMTTKEGLNIILVNRKPNTKRNISFEFRNKYRLIKEKILTAKDMDAYNTVDRKEIIVTSKNINNEQVFNSYIMSAKSMVVLYLKKVMMSDIK